MGRDTPKSRAGILLLLLAVGLSWLGASLTTDSAGHGIQDSEGAPKEARELSADSAEIGFLAMPISTRPFPREEPQVAETVSGAVPEARADTADLIFVERGGPPESAPYRIVTLEQISPHEPVAAWILESGACVRQGGKGHLWKKLTSEPFVVEGVPLGAELVLTWRRWDGWYACQSLVHRGEVVDVDLKPPVRIRARIFDVNRAPLRNVLVGLSSIDPLPGEGIARPVVPWHSDDEGRFVTLLPQRIPRGWSASGVPYSLPRRFRASFSLPGFEPAEREASLVGGEEVDLGRIVLKHAPSIFTLHADQNASPTWPYQRGISVYGNIPKSVTVHWREGGRQHEALIASIWRADAARFEMIPAHPRADLECKPHGILIEEPTRTLSAWRDGERYRVDPVRVAEFTIDASNLDPLPHHFRLFLTWRGIERSVPTLGSLARGSNKPRVWQRVPARGVTLGWSEKLGDGSCIRRSLGPVPPRQSTLTLYR